VVLGRMRMRWVAMGSSRFSGPRAFRSTRRTATVTMSAPEASWASRMTWRVGYLPVPTMRRDRNSRPARINESLMISIVPPLPRTPSQAGRGGSAAADEGDDLERVAVVESHRGVLGAGHDPAIVLDRDRLAFEGEPAEELRQRGAGGHGHGLPVHRDVDSL